VGRREPLLRETIAKDAKPGGGRGRDLTRRMLYLPALIVAAVLMACAVVVLVVSEKAEATFPGKNGKIAFAGLRQSDASTTNNWEIYTTRPRSFELVNITNTLSATELFPAWSPNGRKIAYERYPSGSIDSDIYVMNARGKVRKRLTDNSVSDSSPVWSPDGSKIAFFRSGGPNIDIYIMNADGSNVRRLTNNSNYNTMPSWSPDGTKIAFQSSPPNNDAVRDIHTINVDGSDEKNLTNSTAYEGSPDWSPDGSKIAFSGNPIGPGIHVMNANGTDVKYLLNADYPAWSPNGKRIAFVTRDEVAAVNPDGSGFTFLSQNSNLVGIIGPDWQPRP
jgi:Tol biopolymer transport system component